MRDGDETMIRTGRGRWAAGRDGDRGAALITVVSVIAALGALTASVTALTVHNLQAAQRDQQGGAAFGVSEAGVAAGIERLRAGVGGLNCPEQAASSCPASTAWNGPANAVSIQTSSSYRQRYCVYITYLQLASPPTQKVGQYRLHSQGSSGNTAGTCTAGSTQGLRTVTQDVAVTPFTFPIGIFADEYTSAGSSSVHHASIYSRSCIQNRDKIGFDANDTDLYYGTPVGARSTQYVTTDNNSCGATDNRNIHRGGRCNTSYPFDADALGGDLSPAGFAACYRPPSFTTSQFTTADLNRIAPNPKGLTESQYAALRARAQSQGQLYLGTTSFTAPNPAVYPNAVMYFDLTGTSNKKVSIQNELNAYGSAYCGARSLVIVVRGPADLDISAGADLTGSLFVPDSGSSVKVAGGALLIGTLWADDVQKGTGTSDIYMQPCWLSNIPGGLLDVTPTRFRQVDR